MGGSQSRPVGLRDKAILEVFYSSGIRLEEMTRLNLEDVDWKNGFLRVNQGKFAKDRVVPLGQNASQWIRRYIEQVRAVWSPPSSNLKALWLATTERYLRLTITDLKEAHAKFHPREKQ